jgi:hypothetical protein
VALSFLELEQATPLALDAISLDKVHSSRKYAFYPQYSHIGGFNLPPVSPVERLYESDTGGNFSITWNQDQALLTEDLREPK